MPEIAHLAGLSGLLKVTHGNTTYISTSWAARSDSVRRQQRLFQTRFESLKNVVQVRTSAEKMLFHIDGEEYKMARPQLQLTVCDNLKEDCCK